MDKSIKITKHFVTRDELSIDLEKRTILLQLTTSPIDLLGLLYANKYLEKEVEMIYFDQLEQRIHVRVLKCESDSDAVYVKKVLDDYILNKQAVKINNKYKHKDEKLAITHGTLFSSRNDPIDLLNVYKFELRNQLIAFELKNGKAAFYSEINEESLNEVYLLVTNYLKKVKTVAIFKDLQRNNPMLSPKEAWVSAEETYSLLDGEGVANVY